MNSIRRITPTNLLPRGYQSRILLSLATGGARSRVYTVWEERVVGTRASRITRRARRASGTAGFIHSSLSVSALFLPRPSPVLRPSRLALPPFRSDGDSRRIRSAECPRNTFVRERPPVKTRKTRHYRISNWQFCDSTRLDATRRDATRRLASSSRYPVCATIILVQWDRSYFRRSELRAVIMAILAHARD